MADRSTAERMARDQRVESVPVGVGKQPPRQAHRAQHARSERSLEARERMLQESVVEARVVRDEHAAAEHLRAHRRRSSRTSAPTRTIASVMPVSAWIAGGNRHLGIDQRAPFGHLRHAASRVGVDADDADFGDAGRASARVPVVSRSTKAKRTGSKERAWAVRRIGGLTAERSFAIVPSCRTIVPIWRAAGLLRAAPRAAVVRVDRQPARLAIEVVGGGDGGAAEARRLPRVDARSAARAHEALFRAAARRARCTPACRRPIDDARRCADASTTT